MDKRIIGIIGFGVVGKAAHNTFKKEYDIVIYDKYSEYDSFERLKICDWIFVMVPTPFDVSNGKFIDDNVIESLDNLKKINYTNNVVIKSTLMPGSISKYLDSYDFNIVYNPEFLRESTTPNEDFENQHTVVIGTNKENIFCELKMIYEKVLVGKPSFYQTNFKEAEMIKCSQNTMLASRVAIANMIYDACSKIGVSYKIIKEIAFDQFDIIGPHMSQVPGPDGKFGFGGKCLPKDTLMFSKISQSDLVEEIINYNYSLRDDLEKVLINYEDN